MTVLCQGNFITVSIKEGEGDPPVIRLPDGYTYEKIQILVTANIPFLIPYMQISPNYTFEFPCINSTSPCTIQPVLKDPSAKAELKFVIEKFRKDSKCSLF